MFKKSGFWQLFKEGLIRGFAWAIGAALGTAFLSTAVVAALSRLGGFSVIGNFLAAIVEATLNALPVTAP